MYLGGSTANYNSRRRHCPFPAGDKRYLDGGNANSRRELGKIYCAWGELLSEQGVLPPRRTELSSLATRYGDGRV